VTDRFGTPFVVLSAMGLEYDVALDDYEEWRLICRNLRIAFQLTDYITIEAPLANLDGTVNEVKQWVPRYTRLPAKVELLSSEIAEERGIRGAENAYAVYLAVEVDIIVSRDRVVWQAQPIGPGPTPPKVYLDTVSYVSRQSIADLSTLNCKAAV
jgi:hypothetical protein